MSSTKNPGRFGGLLSTHVNDRLELVAVGEFRAAKTMQRVRAILAAHLA